MPDDKHCCLICGTDTVARCQMCRKCTGDKASHENNAGFVSASMKPWDEWESECAEDYSEDSLGPKLAENRSGTRIDDWVHDWPDRI